MIEVKFLKDGFNYGYKYTAGQTGHVYEADFDYLTANQVIEIIPIPISQETVKKEWDFILKKWKYETRQVTV